SWNSRRVDHRHGAGADERRSADRRRGNSPRRRHDSRHVPHGGQRHGPACGGGDRLPRAGARRTACRGRLMAVAARVLGSLPWVAARVIALLRARHSRWLDDVSPTPPAGPPLVSVIVPARNEARNIERCVGSLLATHYAAIEVIVVDDDSSDGTG